MEGWVGEANCIQTFFGFLNFFYIYKVPWYNYLPRINETDMKLHTVQAEQMILPRHTLWLMALLVSAWSYLIHLCPLPLCIHASETASDVGPNNSTNRTYRA